MKLPSLILFLALFAAIPNSVFADPSYAKRGDLAVKETQQRYGGSIIDYLHIGRTDNSPRESEEKFKLWLRKNDGKEFGVYVFIRFDPVTNRLISIKFRDTLRKYARLPLVLNILN
jgi:hypothetical protein